MAAAGTLGVTLLTQAFRMAPAAVVAPFDYTALLWAGVLGWLVWNDAPDAVTLVGAAIIIASGLSLVLSERRSGQQIRPRVAEFVTCCPLTRRRYINGLGCAYVPR